MGIGAGINFTATGVLQALSNLSTQVVDSVVNTLADLIGPWRPPQWSGPPQTTITVPGQAQSTFSTASLGATSLGTVGGITTFSTGISGTQGQTSTPSTVYVFDGVLKLEHTQEIELTRHPVQNGANISDHAFIRPAKIALDILMSDAMQSYTIGQWSGGSSKSVNAFQTMQSLATARTLVTVTTRLKTYTNMLLVAIHAPDENKTKHGLRATLMFEQVFVASINANSPSNSARPQDTASTPNGTVPSTTVPDAVNNTYLEPTPPITADQVTGAGNWSSNPLSDGPDGS